METEGLACKEAAGRTGAMPSPLMTHPLPWSVHGPSLLPMGLWPQCRCILIVAWLQRHSACLVSHSRIPEGWWNCPPAGAPAVYKPYAYSHQPAVERAIGEMCGHPRGETEPEQVAEQIPQTSLVQLAVMHLQPSFSDCIGIKCSL